MTGVGDWRERAAALRDELVSTGKLSWPALREAIGEVPRHHFVPTFFERKPDSAQWTMVSRDDDGTRSRWWERVYANVALVTQVGSVAVGSRDTIGATSSSSAPGLMTRMIELLDVRPGHRVLEIGTGTGYNAALLSYLVGADRVFSVEVDAALVDAARVRLRDIGYQPSLHVADGVHGLAAAGPYDRVLATCAVSAVPGAWLGQLTDDGRILVDVKAHAAVGNLVLLHRDGDRLVGRFDTGAATFMHMRTPAFHRVWGGSVSRDRDLATPSMTTCPLERLWEIGPLWFLIHCGQPDRLDFGYRMNEQSLRPESVFFTAADGAWCEVTLPDGDGPRRVWQAGPRRLWSEIEGVIDQWEAAGRPHWGRLGLTVAAETQTVWLDEPDGPYTWRLPSALDSHLRGRTDRL